MTKTITAGCERASQIAADALLQGIAIARREQIDDETIVTVLMNVAIGAYREFGGHGVAHAADTMTRALASAEANRILEIDARVFGEALGCA